MCCGNLRDDLCEVGYFPSVRTAVIHRDRPGGAGDLPRSSQADDLRQRADALATNHPSSTHYHLTWLKLVRTCGPVDPFEGFAEVGGQGMR